MVAAELKERLLYDPKAGVFTWIAPPRQNSSLKGRVAGSFQPSRSSGYWVIGFGRKLYKAHRLAWLYMTGKWPTEQIDHIDGDRVNNAWANLRLATQAQNQANSKRTIRNQSGYKGVHWRADHSRWAAQIRLDGKNRFLGYFEKPEEAHDVYMAAAMQARGTYASNGVRGELSS